MKKIQLYLLLSVVIVFATGCPKYKPKVDFDRNANTFVNKLNVFINAKYREYLTALPNNPDGAKRARNEAIEQVLPYIDAAYMDFITDLQAGRDRNNFVADLVELGGSAAVGIVNGERPLQIIGVALTAIRGGRRSADLNFYKEQTTPVLISKMDGNRAKVRTTILTREREEVSTYQFGAAISDIVDYYNAGTLVRAFTELHKDTAVQTKQAEDNLQVLRGVPLTPEATEPARNLTVGASDILFALKGELEGVDVAKQAAATAKLKKIVAALEKDKDAAAALKNANVSSQATGGIDLRAALIDIRRSAALVNNTALLNTINQAIVDNAQ
jgi:hypothetical protein